MESSWHATNRLPGIVSTSTPSDAFSVDSVVFLTSSRQSSPPMRPGGGSVGVNKSGKGCLAALDTLSANFCGADLGKHPRDVYRANPTVKRWPGAGNPEENERPSGHFPPMECGAAR